MLIWFVVVCSQNVVLKGDLYDNTFNLQTKSLVCHSLPVHSR